MLISVIIPLYNKESLLEKCLNSILCDKSRLLEVIVVDDASIDNSVSVVKEYQRIDDRIKLIRNNTNKGTFAAREKGIRSAGGEYIFCVDPDDSINGECFKKAEPFLDKADIIAFNTEFVYTDRNEFWGEQFDVALTGKDVLDAYVNCRIQNWGVYPKLIKRGIAFQALDMLNINRHLSISEDLLFLFAVCFLAQTYQHINFTAYYYSYFHSEDSATRKTFTPESFYDAMEQNRYVLQKLTDLFNSGGYGPHFLFMTKKNLADFYFGKIRAIPDTNDAVKEIMIKHLACVMGPIAVYSAAVGSERDFVLTILRKNIHRLSSIFKAWSWLIIVYFFEMTHGNRKCLKYQL